MKSLKNKKGFLNLIRVTGLDEILTRKVNTRKKILKQLKKKKKIPKQLAKIASSTDKYTVM